MVDNGVLENVNVDDNSFDGDDAGFSDVFEETGFVNINISGENSVDGSDAVDPIVDGSVVSGE